MSNSNNFDFLKDYGREIVDEEAYFEKQFQKLFKNLKEKQNGKAEFHDEGGAKKIFSVEQKYAQRTIAQAFLKDDSADKHTKYQFIREALITSKLDHPNIVPVYDIGLDSEERPYFTMKMLAGEHLGQILNKLHKKDSVYLQNFPLSVLLDIFLKTCNAVAYAQSQGILHLDIKPENIQVNDYGEVILIDWGLAWDLKEENVWDDGLAKGTPGYMAPEQIRSETDLFCPATDIYSLGALLYSILTLKRPTLGSDSKKQLQNVLLGHIPEFDSRSEQTIPESLKAVSIKAMSLEITNRYSTTKELIKEITDYQNGFATSAEDASIVTLTKLFYRRQKALCLTAATALSIVIISLMMFISQLKDNERLALEGKKKVEVVLKQLKDSEKQRYDIAMKASDYAVIVQRDEQINQNFEQAERSLENLTQLEIDNYEFWYELGRLKISRLDFKNALNCFQKTVDLGYGDFKYNQIFLRVAQDFTKIIQSRKLYMEDYKELYIRMPYVQIRAFLCKVLHTSQFPTIEESAKFVSFCINQNLGQNNAATVVTNENSLDLDLSGNKKLKVLEYIGGLKVNKLFLQNSTISSILHFYSNDFHTINLSNTKIKSLKSISGENIIAKDLNLDTFKLSREQCSSLDLQHSKVNLLDLRVSKKINNLYLQNSVIRSLKVSRASSIQNLYLSHDQKGLNSDEIQRLISLAKNVIYK